MNNARIIQAGAVLDVSIADFDRVLSVNLRGTFLLGQVLARHMVAEGTGLPATEAEAVASTGPPPGAGDTQPAAPCSAVELP